MSSKLVLRRRTRRRSHLNLARVHCSMSTALQHCSPHPWSRVCSGNYATLQLPFLHCKHCKYCKHCKPL